MSVRKRRWTTDKGAKKEAWVVDYVDQKGERHIKTFARKRNAEVHQAEIAVEVRQGIHTADSNSITVERAAESWQATAAEVGLERATRDQYRQHASLHIVPFIGAVKLSQLSVPLVREFETKLRAGGRSEAMVRKIIVSLGSLIGDAQERGDVPRNVVREMQSRRKRGKENRAARRKRGRLKIGVDIPTREEVKAIVDALQGRWRPLLLTAIFSGLRASELRGLRWQDVDLARREINVRQRADRYNAIGRPKSEAGERTVPMTPIILNALSEWRLQAPTSAKGLVFPNGKGNVECLGNIINRGFGPPQVAAGVTVDGKPKYTGMHSLRHFYASWCINPRSAGGLELSPKVVQERMGHSTIMMTLDVYGHLFPRQDDSEELAAAERSLLA
jgi:integrase